MPMFRSRKPGSPKAGGEIEPATPAKEVESKSSEKDSSLGLRRSARLSLNRSLCNAGKRKAVKPEIGGNVRVRVELDLDNGSKQSVRVRSGKKVSKPQSHSVVAKQSDSVRVPLDLDNDVCTKQCGEEGVQTVKQVEESCYESVKCLRINENEKGTEEDVMVKLEPTVVDDSCVKIMDEIEKESGSVRLPLELDNGTGIGITQCGEEDVQSVKKVEESCSESDKCLRLRSGKKLLKREIKENARETEEDGIESVGSRGKRKAENDCGVVDDSCVKVMDEIEQESGSVRVSMELGDDTGIKQYGEEDVQSVKKVEESCSESVKCLRLRSRRKLSRTEINKSEKETEEDVNGVGEGGVTTKDVDVTDTIERGRRRFSVQDKGKGKAIEVSSSSESDFSVTDYLINGEPEVDGLMDTAMADTVISEEATVNRVAPIDKMDPKERFKSVAKENASRFAHFSIQEEDGDEDELEPQPEANGGVEDWPGPFSTAMKIIKDRDSNMSTEQKKKSKSTPLIWVPKKNNRARFMKTPPSLEELCLNIMAENVDAIASLESVPDALRHKLTHALCDSRNMNHHFFNLLASKFPSEIRVKDCSRLNEDQFTKTFEAIDASNLTVLQLDQCGRCLPDYVLYAILNHLPNKLSALTNISLKGACRLSDAGLSALVTSASALRSINLGCCSLLTSDAIIIIADKLGSVLKELYIDECFGIDAKSILPALLNLQHLEVLSMSRSESVNNSFVTQFVAVQGHKMKELVLADCTRLTDRAIKAIAESCPGICAIDLTNVCKLTDASLGYLANGCETIQTMKFSRNTFSDEAVAAYLEARGGPLTELSLNHVDKVAHHTALSLSKHAMKLHSLDLSWCREMTNEALGLIVDSCLSLKMVKLFGCTQITNVFTHGHSNENVKIVGLQESQILKNIVVPDLLPLRYSSV